MCGIMASKGKASVDKVYGGLAKLEYRGYDSCGIACKIDDRIEVYKSVGYISNLKSTGVLDCTNSNLSIGHTRWATHGGVSEKNSHPHSSASGDFVVVHNGILENYMDLKAGVLSGIEFTSDTDTEVIPQLIEKYYSGDVYEAFVKAIGELKGSFAIVMMCKYDNNLYFARCSSPLIVSKIPDGFVLASDINGFSDKSNVYHVPDNCVGYIDSNTHVYDNNLNKIDVVWRDYSNINSGADIGIWPHFMLKEINEIPSSLRSTYNKLKTSEFALPARIDNVLLVGCGTSYHSSLMGKRYIESIVSIPCECVIASEFIYSDYLLKSNTLAIFISQSGETADTLSAIKRAKELGMFTLAITNVEGSTITHVCDSILYINVGAEICVASTKAYTSQVLELLMLSNILLNVRKGNYDKCGDVIGFSSSECERYGDGYVWVDWSKTSNYMGVTDSELERLFEIDISSITRQVDRVIYDISASRELHLIGKDYDYVTAMEGALKIKEVSYIFTDAYPCGELKHGTLSLIEDGSVVISILTRSGVFLDKSRNAMHEISARGGKCIAISQFDRLSCGDVEYIVSLPVLNSLLMPIVSIIPIDLIAYKVSVSRGINPDKPRNLAKSVTVE